MTAVQIVSRVFTNDHAIKVISEG